MTRTIIIVIIVVTITIIGLNYDPLCKTLSKIFIFEDSKILKERKRKFRKYFIF